MAHLGRYLPVLVLCLATACKTAGGAHALSDQGQSATAPEQDAFTCGKPLAKALSAKLIPDVDQLPERQALAEISHFNMHALIAQVGQMSEVEQQLYEASKQNPFGNTHRGAFAQVHAILAGGGMISPAASGQKINVAVTPPQENELYGAFSCVFTAVGPVDGRVQYGDTIFRVKNDTDEPVWATYSSAFSFMKNARAWNCQTQCLCQNGGKPPAGASCTLENGAETFNFASLNGKNDQASCKAYCPNAALTTMASFHPSDSDRIAYGKTLIVAADWQEWFAYTLVSMLRGKWNKDVLTKDLLEIAAQPATPARAAAWWNYVDTAWLGYLEAKIEARASLNDITSIEVPADKLSEALSWTDVPAELKAKIKALPAPVQTTGPTASAPAPVTVPAPPK